MIVQAEKKIKEDFVILILGVDYEKEDLELDFITNQLFRISSDKLTEIAKKNGYDKWSWSGFLNSQNCFCEAKFQKNI